MNPEVEEILSSATTLQVQWVAARLRHRYDKDACKEIGIHQKTPITKWDNKEDLDRAVDILKREAALGDIESALFALRQLGLDAARTLEKAIKARNLNTAISAVKELRAWILPDRLEMNVSGRVSVDSQFEEALDRAYGDLDEPATISTNGKANGKSG